MTGAGPGLLVSPFRGKETEIHGTPLAVQWLRIVLPLQGAWWVQSLDWELKFCMPRNATRKKKDTEAERAERGKSQ